MEEIDLKKLIFRRLSYLDFLEFKKAAIEGGLEMAIKSRD